MPPRFAKHLGIGLAAALLAVLGPLAASPAAAADEATPEIEVPLVDGTLVRGGVVSVDAGEAVLRVGAETRRFRWAAISPIGVFRIRAALSKPDDGPARLALAELASELGLWAESRAEYEKALALRAIEGKAYLAAVADAESRAISTGIAKALRAADAGDVTEALALARGLKLDFSGARDAKRVDELMASLDARIAQRQAELDAFQRSIDKALLDSDRQKEILVRKFQAKKQIALGDKEADEARALMPKGVVSKVRRLVEEADQDYVAARKELGRLRRIVPKEGTPREEAMALLAGLDKVQYALLYDAAKFFWDARVYDTADGYAARASYIDPVDPKLLELRGDIREHRIRYRASALTNAVPR